MLLWHMVIWQRKCIGLTAVMLASLLCPACRHQATVECN